MMGFLPLIPPDDGRTPPTRFQAKLAIIMGLLVAMLLGFMLFSADQPGSAASTSLWMVLAVMVAIALVGLVVAGLSLRSWRQFGDKPKRDGLDMYTLIDGLVADLDDDEAEYLRRRLDDRDRAARADLLAAGDDLLERRASRRQSD